MSVHSLKLSLPELSYNSKLFFIGSCFSDNMADKLLQDKFDVISNPFGIIFHPDAIVTVLTRVLDDVKYEESDFFQRDGYWFCYEHHSKHAQRDLSNYVKQANDLLSLVREQLQETDTMFITWGSAWGYELEGQIVANCHQQDSKLFKKKLLDIKNSQVLVQDLIKKLQALNDAIMVVFTVSPVRHYKDGLVENQQSKSLLNILCHNICKDNSKSFYFPSYEFVIDHLRDYSFYNADEVHPNDLAVDQIYSFFVEHFFREEVKEVIDNWQGLNNSYQHRSLRKYSVSNLKFKEKLLKQLQNFERSANISCGNEIKSVKKQISEIRQGI